MSSPYSSLTKQALPALRYNMPPPQLGGQWLWEDPRHNIPAPDGSLTTVTMPQILRNMLGIERRFGDAKFRYCQMTGADAALGQVLARAADVAFDNGVTDYDATEHKVTTDQTFVAGAHVHKMLFIDAGTGAGQSRLIIANSTDSLYIERPFDTAPDATSDLTIVALWHVAKVGTGGNIPVVGVASVLKDGDTYAIDEDNFGWVQVCAGGVCDHVLMDGTTSVADQYIVSGGTAGTAAGIGATVDVEDIKPFGIALAAGASITVPARLLNLGY